MNQWTEDAQHKEHRVSGMDVENRAEMGDWEEDIWGWKGTRSGEAAYTPILYSLSQPQPRQMWACTCYGVGIGLCRPLFPMNHRWFMRPPRSGPQNLKKSPSITRKVSSRQHSPYQQPPGAGWAPGCRYQMCSPSHPVGCYN